MVNEIEIEVFLLSVDMGAANSNEPLRVALLGLDAVGDEYTMCLIKAL